jgi:hypothetical protein
MYMIEPNQRKNQKPFECNQKPSIIIFIGIAMYCFTLTNTTMPLKIYSS